jgi:large subunit ribosomal protein L22
MKSIARQLRITPRKLNLIARLVRNKGVGEAMSILEFTPKKGAKLLNKVLKSAVANAENNFKQERDSLYVKEIVVGKATTLKRSVPISKGRMHPILKRSCHVMVEVGVKAEGEVKKTVQAKDTSSKPAKDRKKRLQRKLRPPKRRPRSTQ